MSPRAPILAVGAHPDDIELGCGGALAKYASLGHPIRAVIFSRGRRGTLSDADRAAETMLAFRKLGITDISVHDFEDTKLWLRLGELVSVLESETRQIRPERVFTMFNEDRHQDHRTVYEASAIAFRDVPQLLGYETPSSFPNFRPLLFEGIDNFLNKKLSALKCHRSQGDRSYMDRRNILASARFRGAQVRRGPSGGFIPYRYIF